jgi:hypothetical protein
VIAQCPGLQAIKTGGENLTEIDAARIDEFAKCTLKRLKTIESNAKPDDVNMQDIIAQMQRNFP